MNLIEFLRSRHGAARTTDLKRAGLQNPPCPTPHDREQSSVSSAASMSAREQTPTSLLPFARTAALRASQLRGSMGCGHFTNRGSCTWLAVTVYPIQQWLITQQPF